MLWRTHLAFGILFALVVAPFVNIQNKIIFILLVGIGSLLPDVDHDKSKINRICPVTRIFPIFFDVDHDKSKINRICPVTRIFPIFFKHRGFFHSLFPAILIWFGFALLGLDWVGLSIAYGYVSHLFTDGFTLSGVNLLYPVSKWIIKGPVRTGNFFEFLLLIIVVVIDIILAFRLFF
jgi:inner membrane protein